MPAHNVYNDAPPLTVAEQLAADPSVKAIGTVISKLEAPKPEAEPKLVEVIERKAGNLVRKDY